jgi:hypothetical protein
MTSEFARVMTFVDAYLTSGDYMALWSPVAGPIFADHEPGPFAPNEEPLWEALYDIVYMGQQDSATPGEAKDGLVGGAALQARLKEWRSNALVALSA